MTENPNFQKLLTGAIEEIHRCDEGDYRARHALTDAVTDQPEHLLYLLDIAQCARELVKCAEVTVPDAEWVDAWNTLVESVGFVDV